MSRHKITAEIEVKFTFPGLAEGDYEVAYPEVEIGYEFRGGCPARIRWDENDHPAEAPEIDLLSARLIADDGLEPTQAQLDDWAQEWIDGDGYDRCVEAALYREREDA